jgi:predicted membrane-bound spermidine synthase
MPHESLALDGGVAVASPARPHDHRVAVLCGIFVVSGFCGLIYESIWSHYLKLFVGHAAYAQTVVLVVFIGGMALGATLVGRIAPRIKSPLLFYAAVEAAVGVISLLFHQGFVTITGWGYATLLPAACVPESPCLAQWVLAAAMILPQSVLLGTTFPLMTAGVLRLAPSNPGGKIALFYFLNSIGAVAGVLASAFVLIPAMGLPGALLTAGLLNIAVAAGAYACSKAAGSNAPVAPEAVEPAGDTGEFRRTLLVVAALTGLSSFIYEIAWIRMLSLVVGASTDAFELMLAAFILGLALGGLWVRKRVDRFKDLLVTLAIVQVLMGIAAVATLPVYDQTYEFLAWLLGSLRRSEGGYVLYNLASHGIALLVMLPATFLAGMTLPLITTSLLRGRQGERAIGFVYAANTFGAIAGVIIAVHIAMPLMGLKGALLLGAAIDIGLAVLLLTANRQSDGSRAAVAWTVCGVVALVGTAFLAPMSMERMASGVYRQGMAKLPPEHKIVYHKVGKTANVDVIKTADATSIRTNGKVDASIALMPNVPTADEYTMALAAILSFVYQPNLQTAAVIGFGSGMSTATLLGSPTLKRVDTIEIEPAMVEGARLFGPPVERAYSDPRSRIVIDDAKSYFARSALRYDLIISEPSNPWVSGVASLFTVEFYRQVKRQIADGGLFVQWIQAYEFSDALLATILGALDREFADYEVYASNGGDMIIVASNGPLTKPSPAFTSFKGLKPELERLKMGSLDEIEARRLAGASSVRAMLSQLVPQANSDYYPLVDLGAPRARYVGGQARALFDLQTLAIPVVEMLEQRTGRVPLDIPGGRAMGDRRVAIVAARFAAEWLTRGTADSNAALPRDIGLLRAMLWNCAATPPRVGVVDLMREASIYVNPHLPPAESAKVWAAVRQAPCAGKLGAQELEWLALFEAVGARDATRMGELGRRLAEGSAQPGPLHGYAIVAGATGLVASGKLREATQLLDTQLARVPQAVQAEPVFLLLRGAIARAGA